jgi:hypothetical protein
VGETTPLQIKQQFAPALGAFAVTVSEADDLFSAPLIYYRQWFASKPREAPL